MKKTLFLFLGLIVAGCTTDTELKLTDLPPVYAPDGTSSAQVVPNSRPANALNYAQIDTLIRNSSGSVYAPRAQYDNYASSSGGYMQLNRTQQNIVIRPGENYYFSNITYAGDRFVPNEYGFAEQETGEAAGGSYYDYTAGFTNTKLVLGGGTTGLNYVDFGYWIGVPKNTSARPLYLAFAQSPYFYASFTPSASTTYSGKAAAVSYNNSVAGSARELGGDATLTLDSSTNTQLTLAFENYYTFNISSNYNGGSVSSVIVNGTNSNGGVAFSSCTSGCSSITKASYFYTGQYSADEAGGVYHYQDGGSVLTGSFGASKD